MQCVTSLTLVTIIRIRTTSSLIKYAENSSDDDHFNTGKRHHPRDDSVFDDASDYDVHDDAAEPDGDGDDDDDDDDDNDNDDDNDDDDDDDDDDNDDDSDEASDGVLTSDSIHRRNTSNNNKDDGHTAKVRRKKIATFKQDKRLTRCSTGASQAVDHNPDNHSRTSKMGRKDGETLFEYHCRCLSTYKEIYSNLLVPQKFVVPWSKDWPQEMWDLKLGRKVCDIRVGKQHAIYREELIALGFDFSKRRNVIEWVTTKLALETYKRIYGTLEIPQKFKVPHNSPYWSEATWGIALGVSANNIRSKKCYSEHRDELIRLGFSFNRSK